MATGKLGLRLMKSRFGDAAEKGLLPMYRIYHPTDNNAIKARPRHKERRGNGKSEKLCFDDKLT